ncbi:MAG: hypothetical protein AB7U20_24250, partial [Planctomycetaceae bacterium]
YRTEEPKRGCVVLSGHINGGNCGSRADQRDWRDSADIAQKNNKFGSACCLFYSAWGRKRVISESTPGEYDVSARRFLHVRGDRFIAFVRIVADFVPQTAGPNG